MRAGTRFASLVLVLGALATPVAATGCYHHAQNHSWSDDERPHYEQWERETHRDHVEYSQRSDADQREYWEWRRHNQ